MPTRKSRDIVILDNLGSHRNHAVREAVRSVGTTLAFLPPNSPDLNPIEQVFAKLKTIVRKARARTCDAVGHAITSALRCFAANDLVNSGYASI